MNTRTKKFFSYYKPYLGLFFSVMFCAFLVAGITLLLPLCVRYVTKNILETNAPDSLEQILRVGALMLGLLLLHAICNFYVDYRGHVMGAMMESDMRSELFDHYQELPFRFHDEQQTGQLMSRLTNDLLSLAELYHHGPEDYAIYTVKFVGAFIILFNIDTRLTLMIFLFLPILVVFTLYFNKRIYVAYRRNRERIGDVNAQLEDTLSGIRVVKSFVNEEIERKKFTIENNRFLESRIAIYRNDAYFYQGIGLITQMITVTVVVFGGISITRSTLDLADLITFLLYISNFIEPIQKLTHMTEQFQEGIASFNRFVEMLQIEPEVQDAPKAIELKDVKGNLEFRNVAFRYRDDHAHVLKKISLQVRAGEYVALVGSSGAGKSRG